MNYTAQWNFRISHTANKLEALSKLAWQHAAGHLTLT